MYYNKYTYLITIQYNLGTFLIFIYLLQSLSFIEAPNYCLFYSKIFSSLSIAYTSNIYQQQTYYQDIQIFRNILSYILDVNYYKLEKIFLKIKIIIIFFF